MHISTRERRMEREDGTGYAIMNDLTERRKPLRRGCPCETRKPDTVNVA